MTDAAPKPEPDSEQTPAWVAEVFAWPVCPKCQRRRQTACPICGVAGSDFPPVDFQPSEAAALEVEGEAGELQALPHEDVLLMCPACDEAFTPKYYRRCEQCGHRFGHGIESDSQPSELTGRALWVLLALLFAAVALLIYFWLLLR